MFYFPVPIDFPRMGGQTSVPPPIQASGAYAALVGRVGETLHDDHGFPIVVADIVKSYVSSCPSCHRIAATLCACQSCRRSWCICHQEKVINPCSICGKLVCRNCRTTGRTVAAWGLYFCEPCNIRRKELDRAHALRGAFGV